MIKMLVCDFDGTISGGNSSGIQKLNNYISLKSPMKFVVATGRTLPSIKEGLSSDCYPAPLTIISDVGTRIHHVVQQQCDNQWSQRIDDNWDREQVQDAIQHLSFLGKQLQAHQGKYKITVEGRLSSEEFATLQNTLTQAEINVDLTYSHDWYLDITPPGVSKASAIRFLMDKHEIKPEEVCVAGDSANDTAMLTMEGIKGILVANHYPEVAHLCGSDNIYTSKATHADGVLEGLMYWQR